MKCLSMTNWKDPKKARIVMPVLIVLFALVNFIHAQGKLGPQKGWEKIELERFSFYVPPGLSPRKSRGRDSEVWTFAGKKLELTIDLGLYSAEPSGYKDEPSYKVEQAVIDGKGATIFSYKSVDPNEKDRPYIAAVHFESIDTDGSKLTLAVSCVSAKEQKAARRIFRSIAFK